MSKKKELKKIIEEYDGIVTTKIVEDNNIHREYLSKMVKEGDLERVAYGVYITPETWEDQMMILQLKRKKMIYSHETALYLNDLTDRDPTSYVVTVPNGYNPTRLKEDGLVVHTVKKELFHLGMCYRETIFGNQVKTYNKERAICDVFRDRNNQDPAIVIDSIKRYMSSNEKDLNKLMKYAELMRVKEVIRPYLDVILWVNPQVWKH